VIGGASPIEATKTCPKCNHGMTPMIDNEEKPNGFWICYTCGIDIPYEERTCRKTKGYDSFYGYGEEQQISEELDIYFYQRYPQFENI